MGTTYSKPEPEPVGEKAAITKRDGFNTSKIVKQETSSSELPPPYPARERTRSLEISQLSDWNESLLDDDKNRLAISTFANQPYNQLLTNNQALQSDLHIFNLTIPIEGAPITNQRSSGRCWLFASTNVFRVPLMKVYQLKDFELSQAYLFYWDKIEKANWFFEQIIATANEDLSDRLVQKLLEDPVTDGGQWDMVANLVKKYGLVPHALYPDAYHAQNSSKLNWLLTAKLREQALVLRNLASKDDGHSVNALAASKDQFLREIHSIVTLLLGTPPNPDKPFVWQYYDTNGTAREVRQTPLEFGQQAFRSQTRVLSRSPAVSPGRMFSLVHDPRNEYNRLLTVDKLGNVFEGSPLTYVNVEMQTLKKGVIAMLKAGHPVFFGCDVGKFSDSKLGVMDADLTDLSLGFNISLGMNKAERLTTGESSMTHAMVITAVHLEDEEPVRWRVENSWGEAAGEKGWFVMTDRWMNEYTFQAVVDSNLVSEEVRAILRQSPKILPRWDPLGVLA
ncbi:cysteine protease [Penicillium argentinense]|uniref:Cysteine proteinase 1, mitochondrial n=1 Tax=Penicillium argentinense TaxID=1131581 RepID=A0A9W9JXS0_9EURO|nr:cysteine protease [Penicillium argentinense]KAJ5085784.1 cysteine protease [Penicillium argentinense]